MTMIDCKECGRPVRLRAYKIRLNNKNGVVNYIEHIDGTMMHSKEWEVIIFKPYTKKNDDNPSSHMINRWNSENTNAN